MLRKFTPSSLITCGARTEPTCKLHMLCYVRGGSISRNTKLLPISKTENQPGDYLPIRWSSTYIFVYAWQTMDCHIAKPNVFVEKQVSHPTHALTCVLRWSDGLFLLVLRRGSQPVSWYSLSSKGEVWGLRIWRDFEFSLVVNPLILANVYCMTEKSGFVAGKGLWSNTLRNNYSVFVEASPPHCALVYNLLASV